MRFICWYAGGFTRNRVRRRPLLIAMSLLWLGLSLAAGSALLLPVVLPILSVGLDAGHGGADPGAVGRGGLQEKEVTLSIARQTAVLLQQAGASAYLIRHTDARLGSHQRSDLLARVKAAGNAAVDIYVSIHTNSFHDRRVRGPRTYYQPGSEEGCRLAGCIQKALQETVGYGRDIQTPEDHLVTRSTPMSAVIVEVGYISNPAEEELLQQTAYQQKLAAAIFAGILSCYPEN